MFDIFSRLAVINEPSLIEVAAAYALRHDFEGLSNYVHYLDVEGHKSQYVRENTEIECKVCENEDDATNITRVVTSATQLVILGITPQDEGFEPTYDGKVSDQGLHILDKLLRLFGANVASKTFRDGAGENHLDKMLYLAASTINDPRVIEALLDAGASVKPRLPMDVLSRERIQTALHQAITFSQFHAATALLAGATDETISTLVSSWIDVDPKRVQDTDTSAAWLFRESPFTKGVLKLLRATEEGCASAQVSEFLDQLETRIPAGTVATLRVFLLGAYLDHCVRENELWLPEAIEALAGASGFMQDRSPILKAIIEPLAAVNGAPRWKCSSSESFGRIYESQHADVLHQALRSHCVPLLEVFRPALVLAGRRVGDGQAGPGIASAVDCERDCADFRTGNGGDYQAVFSPTLFKQTVLILDELGQGTNTTVLDWKQKPCTVLHVLASKGIHTVRDRLPLLLAMGADPKVRNAGGLLPADLTPLRGTTQIWDEIARSFAAHRTAADLIAELEFCNSPPTHVSA